jgi:hypothetical protein
LILGSGLFNITAGNPYYKPHLTRPFDRPTHGTSTPEEDPLVGVIRLIKIVSDLQTEFPSAPVVGDPVTHGCVSFFLTWELELFNRKKPLLSDWEEVPWPIPRLH